MKDNHTYTYHMMLRHILDNGVESDDRTGTGTISVFGYQNRYNLQKGFPAINTKKLHLRSIVYELLWFLRGDDNIQYLQDNGVTIWDEWADEDGNLGPVYGVQWRSWLGYDCENSESFCVDQIANVLQQIKEAPNSRRIMLTAWNPAEVDQMKLPPCHCLVQFYVRNGALSCQLYQRSADAFLGVPFNIASYAMLTHMLAEVCGLKVGDFVHTFGDLHIYKNHLEQVNLQLSRIPKENAMFHFANKYGERTIDSFEYTDFIVTNYNPYPTIKAPVAV